MTSDRALHEFVNLATKIRPLLLEDIACLHDNQSARHRAVLHELQRLLDLLPPPSLQQLQEWEAQALAERKARE